LQIGEYQISVLTASTKTSKQSAQEIK